MADRYRPAATYGHGPPRMPAAARDAMYHFTGNKHHGRPSKPAERRSRPPRHDFRRLQAFERPLLTQNHGATDRQSFRDPEAKDRYRNLADLTDSEEGAMVESDSEDDDDDTRSPKKARLNTADSPVASQASKWSNPDVYTALPPPSEVSGKRVDVVKLIRKAKITDSQSKEASSLARNDDFISFDDDDLDLLNAPTEPSAHRLGKRKRGQQGAAPRPPGGYRPPTDDAILPEWQLSSLDKSVPWHVPCRVDDTASIALHKEIIDFYEWVRPKEYDIEVRIDVINRLTLCFNRIEPGQVKPFGSFAAELYLPTGDMDLVFLQRNFRPGIVAPNGLPERPKRRLLERFGRLLRDTGIARVNSVQLIPFSKVPIIKFVDDTSGLKVDLSFNNETGVVANETVATWKSTHPAMPILVFIIKQFLLMRGLNDVAIGGLGGFSVICLVTSLIQHMPSLAPATNMGQYLVEFFNLYGNLLDFENIAIRLDPPAYLDKDAYKTHIFNNEKRNRLSIIDPNRPENNVSGGTHLIEHILESFANAHETLQNALSSFGSGEASQASFSFLRELIGGNFETYSVQRKTLQGIYFGLTGREASEPALHKPDSQTRERGGQAARRTNAAIISNGQRTNGTISNPEISKASGQDNNESVDGDVFHDETGKTTPSKSQRRAARLKLARPDLADQIGGSVSLKAAVKMGDFADGNALHEFLTAAEMKPAGPRKRSVMKQA